MTSFSFKKPIFRQPKSFKSLDIILSVRIEHSADRALFPLDVITPVVVSSLLPFLTWPSLLFLSPLFLPRTPTQTTSVLKFFFPTTLPHNSFTSTPLPSETLSPSDSCTRTFSPDILPNSPDTFILGDFIAHHPTWDSLIPLNPPENGLFRWITSSGLEILNDPSPTLLHHSTGSRSSPDISLAPASLAPHCEWHTLPGLGFDHLPIKIVLPFSAVRHSNTRPPRFN